MRAAIRPGVLEVDPGRAHRAVAGLILATHDHEGRLPADHPGGCRRDLVLALLGRALAPEFLDLLGERLDPDAQLLRRSAQRLITRRRVGERRDLQGLALDRSFCHLSGIDQRAQRLKTMCPGEVVCVLNLSTVLVLASRVGDTEHGQASHFEASDPALVVSVVRLGPADIA